MKRALTFIVLIFGLTVAPFAFALAQTHHFTLDSWTIDGGGGTSSDSRYTLQATIGQSDAGSVNNARYTLSTGYWDSVEEHKVYLPVVVQP